MDITIPVPQVPPFSPLCIFRPLTVPFPVTPPAPPSKKKKQFRPENRFRCELSSLVKLVILTCCHMKVMTSKLHRAAVPHDYTVGIRKLKSTVVCGILCSLALKNCSGEAAVWNSL